MEAVNGDTFKNFEPDFTEGAAYMRIVPEIAQENVVEHPYLDTVPEWIDSLPHIGYEMPKIVPDIVEEGGEKRKQNFKDCKESGPKRLKSDRSILYADWVKQKSSAVAQEKAYRQSDKDFDSWFNSTGQHIFDLNQLQPFREEDIAYVEREANSLLLSDSGNVQSPGTVQEVAHCQPIKSSLTSLSEFVDNLESNINKVMNKFLTNVGVSDEWSMIDVIDLDEEHLLNLPKKVKAVLLLFPKGEQHEEHCQSEQEAIDSEGQVVSDRVYFMKLDSNNASGTVSIIHAVANADDELELAGDSLLKEFLDRTKDMSPEERGQELEMDETLCCVHETVAKEGQTEAPEADEETNLHFITFVAVDEQLYELDAHKTFPVNHGSTTMETLMMDAVAACKKFMERDPENVNFSIMALVGGVSADTEEEEVED